MKVEVWSDIMCPFCYIGKHNYEHALQQFADAAAVELEWKSFQLDPTLAKNTSYGDTYQYLSDRKGISLAQAEEMTANVARAGAAAGLQFHFDRAIVTNTFDAHRLLHFAKARQLGNELKEKLFHAHFTAGKNVGDTATLVTLAAEIGLDGGDAQQVLQSNQYADEVAADIREARQIGIQGVPFFIFNRKYAVSGAQPTAVFLQTLEKSFAEWRSDHPKVTLEVSEGPSCSPDGTCA
ncbi:DsbA family oxidoreductase [Parapedobacter lycopersici]|uniref:DsbA family oxidoreductase n=1 Tax=Parapedobacter lycopersici TaxID=1864939 RepID=UPI00214D9AFF|nr:DsbA family oxidoreductase [Parapedobacter lycopersici]